MRIAQVAPLYERVPPEGYGGTERVVSHLTEELVRRGHEVTLYATGDSLTSARLVPMHPRALRLAPVVDPLALHILMLERVFADSPRYDLIHFHVDYLHFPLSRVYGVPQLTTLHGRLDLPELGLVYREFHEMPLVSISDSQRGPIPHANWLTTIYHGLPRVVQQADGTDGFRGNAASATPLGPGAGKDDDFLVFLGRLSPEKRVDRAIRIAIASGLPLKVAGKVDRVDREYFEREIAHLLEHPLVEYVGEKNDAEKGELLRHARALLFPIDWPEPFGLVLIEAMAEGTPVIAYPHGSVPEIVEHGRTGFLVSSEEEAVQAVTWAQSLDRRQVRRAFEERFTVERMTDQYEEVYGTVALWRGRSPIRQHVNGNADPPASILV